MEHGSEGSERIDADQTRVRARVSTHYQQTLRLQVGALRAYAKRRGLSGAAWVKEVGSGAVDRPRREELMREARQEVDTITI